MKEPNTRPIDQVISDILGTCDKSKVDYMVKGVFRKPEAMLRTLIYEVIADDIDTN